MTSIYPEVNPLTGEFVNQKVHNRYAHTDLEARVTELEETPNSGVLLVPDATHPGLYVMASGSSLTPDPANAGLYLMGA